MARRQKRWQSLSPLEQAQIRQRDRERNRDWYYRNHDEILAKRKRLRDNMTEEELMKRRIKHRQYRSERIQKKALAELFEIGAKLNERINQSE